ncbi:hypothetical protein GCM10027275_21010 [Rhabdobacter roseus]|uniref:CheY-like chemotaxis protein n=1 Tax=Rhabdobacter roseus TaxID=1655419 RepID=A0A840TM78_9BACT|nr:response regulator [Rhabdobacter roseus]MBB5284035.1 CheY-like chemotaxis protein [Rhabdobacter roseus]
MKKYKIILVENDEDERFFMKEGFHEAGLFDILAEAENGDELLAWLTHPERTLPDVILSDLNMPGKNGYDILAFMKANPIYASIPIIITSTSSTPAFREQCLALGATDYMTKPDTFVEYAPFARTLYRRIEEKKGV